MTNEEISKVIHEANKAYCEVLGDTSQTSWESAPAWQKDSAILGVELIRNNPSTSSKQSHDSWLNQKRKDGWKYGLIKDAEKKEHPCFVEYEKLPESQQKKDALFGAIVRALL
jgi:hypothetical protein